MNNSIKIQFLTFFEEKGSRGYPNGILFLSAYLKEKGFSNIQYKELQIIPKKTPEINTIISIDEEIHFKSINQYRPDVILLGPVFSYTLSYLPNLCMRLKQSLPNVLIFAGGYHFGSDIDSDRQFLRKYCPDMDGILIGKAEETIYELMKEISSERTVLEIDYDSNVKMQLIEKIGQIPGILTLANQYQIRKNHLSIRDIPIPDYELLFTNPFRKAYTLADRKNPHIRGNGTIFEHYLGSKLEYGIIVGSRGCPYDCAFCAGARPIDKTQKQIPREVRTADQIYREMVEVYQKYGTRLFLFSDPLFMAASQHEITRINELCEKIEQSPTKFRFIIEIRVDVINSLPSPLLARLIKCGFIEFNLGLEKGTNAGLLLFSKRITTQDQKAAVKKLRKISKGIKTPIIINGTYILGGPNETLFRNILSICNAFTLPLDHRKFFILELYPNTRIYQIAIKNGIIKKGIEPYMSPNGIPLYITFAKEYKILKFLQKITIKLDQIFGLIYHWK